MKIFNYAIFVFLLFLRNSLPNPLPENGDSDGNTDDLDYLQQNLTAEENVNRIWNEYWSDWVNIGVVHANDTSFFGTVPNHEEIETRFLSVLHRVFKKDKQRCADQQSRDCQEWADQGFCTHVNSRYRGWMRENCPQSCDLCDTNTSGTVENGCSNKRQSCDLFFRFCTGPFEQHMAQWCPKTCNLCSTSNATEDQENEPEDREGMAILTPTPTGPTNEQSSESCFPRNCGTVPVMTSQERARVERNAAGLRTRIGASLLKIVGGSRAMKGEWPWHGLLLQQVNEHARYCGITIICKHWVVTAAHCVVSPQQGTVFTRQLMKTFTLFVGRHKGLFSLREESTQSFLEKDFDRFVVHPSFRLSPSFSHDIALIKLKRSSPIHFNRFVQPVCLPTVNNLNHGDILTTYGWGETQGYGPSAQYLKDVRLPFVDSEMCRRKVWGLDTTGVLCAGGIANRDTCTGDSGGSLVLAKTTNDTAVKRFFFYGITSYGTYYCNSRTPYKPGVYTDIAHYSSWIQEHTNGCCTEASTNSAGRQFNRPNPSGHIELNSASNMTSFHSFRGGDQTSR